MQPVAPLLQLIVVPIVLAPITYAVGRGAGKHAGWLAFATSLYMLVLIGLVGLHVHEYGSLTESYTWAPLIGMSFNLLADGLNIWVLATIVLLCMVISVYSIRYMEHRISEMYEGDYKPAHATYYALYLLYEAGMVGTVLSTNLIQFYLFYELMLIPSWALINNYGYGERERIGIMYFLWTHVGAVLLLAGILTAYTITGSFDMTSLSLVESMAGRYVATLVMFAILIGFFVKMAVFILHIWLPYAHAEAPTPISALLSPAMIGIGGYAIARIVIENMYDLFATYSLVFAVWALVTMVYGGLMAMAQDDIKRFLAYSSISQMGYLFLGLATASTLGVAGAMFHYVSHGLGKCILFSVAGILICQVGTRSIRKMGGLAARMPATAVLCLIGFLTISGVPPTSGFMSKWLLFLGVFSNALSDSSPSMLVVAIIAIIMTVITVGYCFWTMKRVFFGPLPEELKDVREAPAIMLAPLFLLAVVSLLIGIYPRAVTDFLVGFLSSLLS